MPIHDSSTRSSACRAPRLTRLVAAVAATCAAAALAACSSTPAPVEYARPFPQQLVQAETVDVQVFRREKTVFFTNTTARRFERGTMWLNRRYSRPFEPIAPGESFEAPLHEFRDEFGEPFRAGGFFASEFPDRLVLAQLETPQADGRSRLVGLVVVQSLPEQ